MFKFLNNLREKPIAYRKKVAFGTSLFLTLIILVMWAISFEQKIRNMPDGQSQETMMIREAVDDISSSLKDQSRPPARLSEKERPAIEEMSDEELDAYLGITSGDNNEEEIEQIEEKEEILE